MNAAARAPSKSGAPVLVDKGKELSLSAEAFQTLAEQMRSERGLDLLGYKDRYARRRISVRLRVRQCASLEDYLELLQREPAEWDRLLGVLSINVSNFYRNPETFETIRSRLLPDLFQWRKRHGQPRLRLWSAGCSDGDEAYSLAVLLREHFPGPLATMAVSILGTDIDEGSLARARAGSYPESRLADLPPGLREKHFSRRGEEWVVRRRVAALVQFQRHDLLRDPAPEDLDLILCRNVLIYLSRDEQEPILARLSLSLRPGGYLVLGKTETLIGRLRRALIPVLPRERIYQRPEAAAGPSRQEVGG